MHRVFYLVALLAHPAWARYEEFMGDGLTSASFADLRVLLVTVPAAWLLWAVTRKRKRWQLAWPALLVMALGVLLLRV